MKHFIACIAAIAIASSSYAITPGSSAAVTLALQASITTPGLTVDGQLVSQKTSAKTNSAGEVLAETTEYKTAITTLRYGNAQIIADLNASDMLDGTVSGWSIIAVYLASDFGSGSDRGAVPYAVKKGRAPVLLEFTSATTATAELVTGKVISDYVKQTVNFSVNSNQKSTISLVIGDFNIQGLDTRTFKMVTGKLGNVANGVNYAFPISGGSKIPAFSGTYAEGNVAEGSLSIAPAKVIDLETLGFSAQTPIVVMPN